MSNDRFASAHEMVREYQELEKLMADPSIHEDQGKARQLGRRYAQLGPVIAGFNEWKSAADDLEAAKEMALEDPDFASEIPALVETVERTAESVVLTDCPPGPEERYTSTRTSFIFNSTSTSSASGRTRTPAADV